jgi:hypothetical protein
MVSRSLEKMLLIAIGLTTVVMVGVPVLLYAMNTLSSASELEMAQHFADRVHNATGRVDLGQTNNTSIEISVPQYVSVTSDSNSLTITYDKEGRDPFNWGNSYTHPILLTPPTDAGVYIMSVSLVDGEIHLVFTAV